MLPVMRKDLSSILINDFDLYIDDIDPNTICFQYPRTYEDSSILQIIRLEIGVLAEPMPSSFRPLHSYIYESYSVFIDEQEINVYTVSAIRTFYEKLTILHREANRSNGNYPKCYSRHFYDIYKMIENGIGDEALHYPHILKKVIDFKKKFYPCNWANYDEAICGHLKLILSDTALEVFRKDYGDMSSMIYGNRPNFDVIIGCLKVFESRVNKLVKVGKMAR